MSLMKVRDMSILNTAPQNRLPIETYVTEFNEELVARAVREEIGRGGQVYYLHNRVETIDEIHLFLQKLVPEASIAPENSDRSIVIASRSGSLSESRSARGNLGIAATKTPTVGALLWSASPSG